MKAATAWELLPLRDLATLLLDRTPVMEGSTAFANNVASRLYDPDHPDLAIDLNNLALLLWETDRPAEAEPLMRRALTIFARFTKRTGYEPPHLQDVIGNYTGLLEETGLTPEEFQQRIEETLRL